MLSIFLYFLHLGFLWSRSWIMVGSFQKSQVIRFAILKKEKKNHCDHHITGKHITIYLKWNEVKVTQLCLPLCDPTDYTVHGILQARILEWVAFPFSRGSSQPRDQTQVSRIAGGFFTSWATREAHNISEMFPNIQF